MLCENCHISTKPVTFLYHPVTTVQSVTEVLYIVFQESLGEIQLDIETEQQSLATEQARQNRIAATVSNEMFTECQVLSYFMHDVRIYINTTLYSTSK